MRTKTVFVERPSECPFIDNEYGDWCKLGQMMCDAVTKFPDNCPLDKCTPPIKEVYGTDGRFLFKTARVKCKECGHITEVILIDAYAKAIENKEDVPTHLKCVKCDSNDLEWVF